ncbi:MAG TPA: hypothetical protein DCL48_13880 [Alphaproteobacteria bacterium]|nr:hypothetical protein [Alphaproteobacteria bacterium]
MVWGRIVAAVWLLCAGLAGAQQEVAPDPPLTSRALVQARLERAAATIDQARGQGALGDLDAVLKSEYLTPDLSDWAHHLRARALVSAGRGSEAEALARQRYAGAASGYNFKSLISILALRQRWAAGAQVMLDVPKARISDLNAVALPVVETILNGLERAGDKPLYAKVLAKLTSEGYQGLYGGKTDDTLRLRHIAVLTGAGQLPQAVQEAKFLETPAAFVALLADRRFEPLWALPEIAALTPQLMQERVRARADALVARGISHGGEALEAVRGLRAAGDPLKAAQVAADAVGPVRRRQGGARYAKAILLERAYAFADLGRVKDAAAVFDVILKQFPEEPIAVKLASARVLEGAGQAKAALAVLETLDMEGLSAPAQAVALAVTACAQAVLGQKELAAEARDELAALGLNAAPAALEAALCARDDAGARALVLAWLSKPELRGAAVAALQLYEEPRTVLPAQLDRRRRLRALIASADVQAAVFPHGRTMAWSFQRATAVSY